MSKRRLLYVITTVVLVGCAHRSTVSDSWSDATLVADQAAVIEQQRATLDNMGEAIGQIRSTLADARGDLERALQEGGDLRSLWREIDAFVSSIIEAERALEELQRTDSGADAGEG